MQFTPYILLEYAGVVFLFAFWVVIFVFVVSVFWESYFPAEKKFKDCWFCPLTRKERAIQIYTGILEKQEAKVDRESTAL